MVKLKELDDFLDDGLELPIKGKTYLVPPASAEVGLYCQRLAEVGMAAAKGQQDEGAAELDDARESELYRKCLGPVLDEMVADGVSWPRIKHAAITAFFWIAGNDEAAATFWERGPEAAAPEATKGRAASSTS
ncbi:hypothetical protein ACIBH1_45095 [Nonomuraea sp. NPDC050663]|uniref:DUF7426 family protein n=1 Tax=Nonomuraea sp. NPDC050663 TaxID=3364370 RepID=UPI0037906B3E